MRTILVAALGLVLLGCATAGRKEPVPRPPVAPAGAASGATAPPDASQESWAARTLAKLTLEEKVGQLFMIWVRAEFMNVESPVLVELEANLERYHVGGLAMSVPVEGPRLVKSRPEEAALLLNRLQKASKHPLLVAADFEVGVASRLDGATQFPQAMAFGAAGRPENARDFGRITALEARALGVHWNFVPVADVNSNPDNPIINTRSFGEDPSRVGELVAQYVRGAREGGMLTTAKHFPGHGDTATDSHYGVAQVSGDLDRLEAVELPPFERAIEAGVDSVMVAHVTVPAIEPSPDRVATTSPAVVTDLLKTRLGFGGLVVTDALDMGALTRMYAPDVGRAAVDAFKAGNDYLIIPADLPASWQAMVDAVKSGQVSATRLDEAVMKVLTWKEKLGLHRDRLVDVDRVSSLVGQPENVAAGQQIADDAMTLVRDEAGLLPLTPTAAPTGGLPYLTTTTTRNRLVVVILTRDIRGLAGREFDRELRRRVPDANVVFLDSRTAGGAEEDVLRAAEEAEAVVVAAFVSPEPGAAEADSAPGDPAGLLLQSLLGNMGQKTVVVAVGSPYVAQAFPGIQTYLCTFSGVAVSERSAVKALFGEIPTRGRLPVTIPGVAKTGDGLE